MASELTGLRSPSAGFHETQGGMRVSLQSLLVIVGVILAAAIVGLTLQWLSRRRKDAAGRAPGSPLLVMQFGDAASPDIQRPLAPSSSRPSPIRNVAYQARVEPREEIYPPVATPDTPAKQSAIPIMDPVTAVTGPFVPGSPAPELIAGHSLRFHRPMDGTLEFLPGHLEVVGGPDAGHAVHFVRPGAGQSADITFGRREGPPYRHIQLLEPTVSRSHARLTSQNGQWHVANLSRTNPVVLNRTPLDSVDVPVVLADGDLIEMGALVFRFHSAR